MSAVPAGPLRAGGALRGEAEWSGDVSLESDLVVEEGATLRVRAGARLSFPAGEGGSSWERRGRGRRLALGRDGARHLKVLGALELLGTADRPVLLEGPGFGGVLLGGRARLRARHARFEGGVGFCLGLADLCSAELSDCSFRGGLGAALCCGFSRVALRRCSLSGGTDIGLFVCDDASARAAGCGWEGNRWAIAAEGAARVALRGCRIEGNARGADLSGWAALRSAGVAWTGQDNAALAHTRSRARFTGDRFARNGVALEALDRAELRARGCAFESNGRAAFLQQDARLAASRCELDGNEVGFDVRQDARLELSGSRVRRCGLLPVRREDRARASLGDSEFDADPWR